MKDNIEKYEYHIFYSEEDASYIGTVAEFPYLSSCESTPKEAYVQIKNVIKDAMEVLQEEAREIPIPFIERNLYADSIEKVVHQLIIAANNIAYS